MSTAGSGPGVPAAESAGADRAETLVPHNHLMAGLLGHRDELLRLVEDAFPETRIAVQGNQITAEGPEAERVARLFDELVLVLESGPGPRRRQGGRAPSTWCARTCGPSEVLNAEVLRAARGRTVRPNTAGQKRYTDAIAANTITFGIGPAGTGKSYLAVALAVQALQSRQVNRIILTRPAVEAGERLGFLPGDLMAKVDPYLRPLYDALYDLLEPEGAQRLLDRGTIEVAPLAFMRGRTLNSSFIILDEAQNTTPEQMKMFLTRIGFGSKCVVTGDVTQIDVAGGRSGLVGLEAVLGGHRGHRLRAPHPARRGPPQDRGRHRRRLRGRRAAEVRPPPPWPGPQDRPPMAVDVFAADEQADQPVDLDRWVTLARSVLADRGVQGRGRGVAALRRRGGHRRAERAVPRRGRARPTCWPSRSRTSRCRAGGRRTSGGTGPGSEPEPRSRCSCSATW